MLFKVKRRARGLLLGVVVASCMIVVVSVAPASSASCAIPVGAGASGSLRDQIVAAHRRSGGQRAVGCATNKVHRWGSGYIQDFAGGSGGRGGIMREDGRSKAFWVHGAIWATYSGSHGGAPGYLGYPISDETGARSAVSGAIARKQRFRAPRSPAGGMLVYWVNGARKGTTYVVHGAVYNSWRLGDPGRRRQKDELGLVTGQARSLLGLPTSNEFNQSGGRRQRFEGGYAHWSGGAFAKVVYRKADRFRRPVVGSWSGNQPRWYNAQGCGSYFAELSGHHLGSDINWGYGEQDVGKTVVSSGFGKIRYSGKLGGYGFAVIVESPVPVPNTDRIQYVSMLYGHLGSAGRRSRGYVFRGTKIGQIGAMSENGGWTPHLHWAVRKYRLPDKYLGAFPGYSNDITTRKRFMQPFNFIAGPRGKADERYNLSPDCY